VTLTLKKLLNKHKSYDFWKSPLHYINWNLTICHTLETKLADRISLHKTGLWVSTCLSCGWASRGTPLFDTVARRMRKLVGLTLPVASRKPNFSPVRAAFQSLWQAAGPIFLRSGWGWGWIYFKEAKSWRITDCKGTIDKNFLAGRQFMFEA
jgi:hypothetical protein